MITNAASSQRGYAEIPREEQNVIRKRKLPEGEEDQKEKKRRKRRREERKVSK